MNFGEASGLTGFIVPCSTASLMSRETWAELFGAIPNLSRKDALVR